VSVPIDQLPLGGFPYRRTDSLDEACNAYASLHVPVVAEPLGARKAFSWEANRVVVDRIALLATRYGGALRCTSPSSGDGFSLDLTRTGEGLLSQARRGAPLRAGERAVLVSSSMPVVWEIGAGYTGIQVVISGPVLEGTLDALLGEARAAPLRFEPNIDVTAGAGASLAHLIEYLLVEISRPGGALSSALVASSLIETLLHTLLLGLPHNYAARLHAPCRVAEPRYLRRVEEYLDANVTRPITAAELATVTGMSVRSVQAAFRSYRGSTPTAFLRARRFELARRRLQSGSYGTVAEVAVSCGFEHLGRFSVGYRERFGESPSATLRRTAGPLQRKP